MTIWHRFRTMKHSTTLPVAFTEHGVAMLANVLNSPRAVRISIHIIKTFIKLREIIANNNELASKFSELERRLDKHDEAIQALVEAIRQLMALPADSSKRKIGFIAD